MAEHPQSAEQVFGEALDLPPGQRGAYLDRICHDAPGLRHLVEELLAEDARAGSFLNTPLVSPSAAQVPYSANRTSPVIRLFDRDKRSRFQPSDVIAERFTVVRFVARGGMGEVYEVQDRFLQGERVALKMILPEIAADVGGSQRFEQEVLLARKINHPNLCPIYDIFHCPAPAPAFLFLTMKMLHGETLDARLKGATRIPRNEAVDICTELLSGVAAIHAAGVIHRDLKPNNIMLERTADRISVSIMDFGLARLHESENTVLRPGFVAGTPGYLAPELIAGGRPTQATDLFALGVVFHQVLTGERPAEAPDGLTVVPRSSLTTVVNNPALAKAVRGFLSTSPEDRCRAFDQLCARQGLSRPLSALTQTKPPVLTRRRFAVTAAASVCMIGGGAVFEHNAIYNLLHPLPSKRFVAVLNWPPVADDRVRPMVLGLIDAMTEELARAEAFDRNFFVAAEKTLSSMTTSAQLNQAGEALGANLILATSARASGADMQVFLHVLDPDSGRTLRSKELRTPVDQQFSLPQQAVHAAAQMLNVEGYQQGERPSGAGTANAQALAAFQAAELDRKQDNDTGLEPAIEKYKQALEIDPNFAVAQTKLGWAYLRFFGLHGDPAALALGRENCESALAIDNRLAEAHLGLANGYEEAGDHDRANEELSRALALDPSNTHTLLYQAVFLVDNGRYQQAEGVFRTILKLRPNYWMGHSELAALLYNRGRYLDALAEFRSASLLSPRNALVLSNIGSVYLQLGKLDEAIKSSKNSLDFAATDGAAVTLASVARLRGLSGDAIAFAQRAVALGEAFSPNWVELGDAYAAAGLASDARAAYAKGKHAEEEELQARPKYGPGWMMLALCNAKTGAIDSVESLIAKAESLNADDMTSQLVKVRVLALLRRHDAALAAVVSCLNRGATSFQFRGMRDLDALRSDPIYVKAINTTEQFS